MKPVDPRNRTDASPGGVTFARKPLLEPGQSVDAFKIVRQAGRGGMGDVYLARDTVLGRRVALKVVRAGALGDAAAARRFLLEARLTARFNHPHIVTVYGVGEHEGSPYVALEYVEGHNLRERLATEPLAMREAVRVVRAIASALVEAHAHGILHRDLKPENVLVGKDGRVRVADFGLARPFALPETALRDTLELGDSVMRPEDMLEGGDVTARARVGTPRYMAPEQWLGQECSSATDIWALGVVLWELLAGEHPYGGAGLIDLCARVSSAQPAPRLDAPGVPEELTALVARCLAKVMEARPGAAEVVEILDAVLASGAKAPPTESCPFSGLLAFTERQAGLFFGRAGEIDAFLERLRREPILPVVGPSGAGKSSFVQAGVVPRLREQGRWLVLTMRPGRDPFGTLAGRLLRADSSGAREPPAETPTTGSDALRDEADDVPAMALELLETPSRLGLRLQQLAEREHARVLLFVDQLEELYTLGSTAAVQGAFVDALCLAADDPDQPVRVIFTLRDDLLGRAAHGEAASDALSRVTVIRSPSPEALEEILRRPLQAIGYDVDDSALIPDMVAAVSNEPAPLPLLQFTAQALWERRDRAARKLTRAAHDAMGGVPGALAHHAESAMAALSATEVMLARQLLLRLVTPEGIRRVVPWSDLLDGVGAGAAGVVHRLAASRLVNVRQRRDGSSEDAEVELVHESLIRKWERLARWIEESREEIVFAAELTQAASLWHKRGEREEEVWQGDALSAALRHADRLVSMSEPAERFLEAGRRCQQRLQRRRRWRLAAAISALALVAAVAVGVALVMGQQKRTAQAHKEEAELKRAEALREGAEAALAREDLLEARAKMRVALELRDTRASRAVWARTATQPVVWKKDTPTRVTRVAFSPQGDLVAAGCDEGYLYLIDARTAETRTLRGHAQSVVSLAFVPDGRHLVSASFDGRVAIWDLQSLSPHFLPDDKAVAVALSPDGRTLAIGRSDGTVGLWDFGTRKPTRSFQAHAKTVTSVAFSPDGRILATSGADLLAKLWDLAADTLTMTLGPHRGMPMSVGFSPDGRQVVVAGLGGGVRLWDRQSGRSSGELLASGAYFEAWFAPDGKHLAAVGSMTPVQRWDVTQPRSRPVYLIGHKRYPRSVALSSDGRFWLSGGDDRSLIMWRPTEGSGWERSAGHGGAVSDAAVTPDEAQVVSVSADGTARIWDRRTGKASLSRKLCDFNATTVAHSARGTWSAFGANDGVTRVWRSSLNSLVRGLTGPAHSGGISAVAFSPDEKLVAAADALGQTLIWETDRWGLHRALRSASESRDTIRGLAFSADGRSLAEAGDDRMVRVWDLPSGKEAAAFPSPRGEWPTAVTYASSGRLLALGHRGGDVVLWDVRTGEERFVRAIPGKVPSRWAFSLSSDAASVAVGLLDGSATIWNVADGSARSLRSHRGAINRVRFAVSGRYLTTSGNDDTVRLWDAATGRPLWHAPVLLTNPPELYSHRGWLRFDEATAAGAPASVPAAEGAPATSAPASGPATAVAWHRAVEQTARSGAQSPDGRLLCVATWDEKLALWDTTADARVLEEPLPGLDKVVATSSGCVGLTREGKVWLVERTGARRPLHDKASAIASAGDEVLIAAPTGGLVVDAAGRRTGTFSGVPDATAVGRVGNWTIVGTVAGLSPHRRSGPRAGDPHGYQPQRRSGARAARVLLPEFAGAPPMAVERIIPGPDGTLIAGFANGFVGVWDLSTGALLRQVKLHGPAVHLLMHEDTLYVATELGDHGTLDLSVFRRGYCDVMREVWGEVPVVWESGQPVIREPPQAHPCAHR